jgi:hypothetical protein
MKRLALALLVLVVGCSSGTPKAKPPPSPSPRSSPSPTVSASSSAYRVDVVPGDYKPEVTNPWFPLPVGRTWEYSGSDEDGKVRELVTVSDEEEYVGGVRCRVVLDRLYRGGAVVETTKDFYAQDHQGNVWYFGEDTAELDEDGSMVTTEGTWHFGVAGAQPGMVMSAVPAVGETHRQEYLRGYAEDFYAVDRLDVSASTPYRSFRQLVQTREWTPLEPDVVSRKLYARGIGLVKELNTKGPKESLALVAVRDE